MYFIDNVMVVVLVLNKIQFRYIQDEYIRILMGFNEIQVALVYLFQIVRRNVLLVFSSPFFDVLQ